MTCGREEVAVMYAVLYSVDAGKMLVRVGGGAVKIRSLSWHCRNQ